MKIFAACAIIIIAALSVAAFVIVNEERLFAGVYFLGKDYSNQTLQSFELVIQQELKQRNQQRIIITDSKSSEEYKASDLFYIYTSPSAEELKNFTSQNPGGFISSMVSPVQLTVSIAYRVKEEVGNMFKKQADRLFVKHIDAEKSFHNGYIRISRDFPGVRMNTASTADRAMEASAASSGVHPVTIKADEEEFQAAVTRQMLADEYNCTLCIYEYNTAYDPTNIPRTQNLIAAVNSADGIILEPYDIFSFNKILGERSEENGYEKASVISRGKLIDDYGGGICQVSSTIYNTVIHCGMDIKERYNHSIVFPGFYVPIGQDAAVVWGYKDFRFENSFNVPVMLELKLNDGTLECRIFSGTQPDYQVKIETDILEKKPARMTVRKTSSLAQGETREDQLPIDGYKTRTYRYFYDGDALKKKELLSRDEYLKYDGVTLIGTRN